ncbi:hypothetical protein [Domibacillus iocasae]|uniref:hypothetical protein n=1 Tax=Domibacillus iocasae TaxID=1714016 RepID=UPI0014717307|nr:hypothetical protein [Domibacillus iocasae]
MIYQDGRDRKELAWKKTFAADEQGAYIFTAKRRLHSRVDGKQAKGGCRIEFSR